MRITEIKGYGVPIKLIFLLLSALIVLILVLVIVLPGLWGNVKQPIAFNHRIHVENDMECEDCHAYFKEYAFSGRPSLEICMACHEEPQGEGDEEKKLMEFIKAEKEIEWKRLYRVPEDVYFSHRRHVVSGNIECRTCHGDIGNSTRPPSRPLKMTMDDCMKCHEENEASNDCIACHR